MGDFGHVQADNVRCLYDSRQDASICFLPTVKSVYCTLADGEVGLQRQLVAGCAHEHRAVAQ